MDGWCGGAGLLSLSIAIQLMAALPAHTRALLIVWLPYCLLVQLVFAFVRCHRILDFNELTVATWEYWNLLHGMDSHPGVN